MELRQRCRDAASKHTVQKSPHLVEEFALISGANSPLLQKEILALGDRVQLTLVLNLRGNPGNLSCTQMLSSTHQNAAELANCLSFGCH